MLKLQEQWETRNKLRAEGDKLCAESYKLYAESSKGYAEGDKLYAEGRKLYAEGNIQWCDAIIKEYGNVEIEWEGDSCILENGDRYSYGS
jgi:hypothetical protein